MSTVHESNIKDPNSEFYEKTESSLRELFEAAKNKHELHFAMALMPEFRGAQDPGWSTADEVKATFREYLDFIESLESGKMQSRIALSFYCHLSEASGFYETPKNMLRIADGKPHVLWPFKNLVQKHKDTGNIIAPNSNKILKDLAGHSKESGFDKLSEVFRDAFNPDIRNAYAHADYIIWPDGLRLRKRNGGYSTCIPWEEFTQIFHKGINFFNILQDLVSEYIKSYDPPKTIKANLDREPLMDWTIYYNPKNGAFGVRNGIYDPNKT